MSDAPLSPGVKTFQHRKAMGNARASVRGTMFPIFTDIGDTLTTNAYGPEPVRTDSSDLKMDPGTGEGILAVGRLERINPGDPGSDGLRVADKEAYRLFWLPYTYVALAGDWQSNPPHLDASLNANFPTGPRLIVPEMRLWMPTTATQDPETAYGNLIALSGVYLDGYRVVAGGANVLGDVLEYEALVVRDEAVTRRKLESI